MQKTVKKSKHEVLVDSLLRTTQMYLHISVYNCDTVQWRTVILIFPALRSIVCSMLEFKNSRVLFAGDLAKAVRRRSDLHFGLYHSLYEWFHPLYQEDKANNFTTRKFVQVG